MRFSVFRFTGEQASAVDVIEERGRYVSSDEAVAAARTDLLDDWPRASFTEWIEGPGPVYPDTFSIRASRGRHTYYVSILDKLGEGMGLGPCLPEEGWWGTVAAQRVHRWRGAVVPIPHPRKSPATTPSRIMHAVPRSARPADQSGLDGDAWIRRKETVSRKAAMRRPENEYEGDVGEPILGIVHDSPKNASDDARSFLGEDACSELLEEDESGVDGSAKSRDEAAEADLKQARKEHATRLVEHEKNIGSSTEMYEGEAVVYEEERHAVLVTVYELLTDFEKTRSSLKRYLDIQGGGGKRPRRL